MGRSWATRGRTAVAGRCGLSMRRARQARRARRREGRIRRILCERDVKRRAGDRFGAARISDRAIRIAARAPQPSVVEKARSRVGQLPLDAAGSRTDVRDGLERRRHAVDRSREIRQGWCVTVASWPGRPGRSGRPPGPGPRRRGQPAVPSAVRRRLRAQIDRGREVVARRRVLIGRDERSQRERGLRSREVGARGAQESTIRRGRDRFARKSDANSRRMLRDDDAVGHGRQRPARSRRRRRGADRDHGDRCGGRAPNPRISRNHRERFCKPRAKPLSAVGRLRAAHVRHRRRGARRAASGCSRRARAAARCSRRARAAARAIGDRSRRRASGRPAATPRAGSAALRRTRGRRLAGCTGPADVRWRRRYGCGLRDGRHRCRGHIVGGGCGRGKNGGRCEARERQGDVR